MSDCPTCDLLAEWDQAMARVRSASRSRRAVTRAVTQAMALDVAERIIAGIERHEQEGPAPP